MQVNLTGEGALVELFGTLTNKPWAMRVDLSDNARLRELMVELLQTSKSLCATFDHVMKIATGFDKATLHLLDSSITMYKKSLASIEVLARELAKHTAGGLSSDPSMVDSFLKCVESIFAGIGLDSPEKQVVYRVGNKYFGGFDGKDVCIAEFHQAFVVKSIVMRFVIEAVLYAEKLDYSAEPAYLSDDRSVQSRVEIDEPFVQPTRRAEEEEAREREVLRREREREYAPVHVQRTQRLSGARSGRVGPVSGFNLR